RIRGQRVPAAALPHPVGDGQANERERHVLPGVPVGQRRDDGRLAARHAAVCVAQRVYAGGLAPRRSAGEQGEDVGRDALDHGVDVGRAGEGGGLGAWHAGPVGRPKAQRQLGRGRAAGGGAGGRGGGGGFGHGTSSGGRAGGSGTEPT